MSDLEYTDSHCHLDALNLEAYQGDLSMVIKEAKQRRVKNMLSVCTRVASCPHLCEVALQYDNIWCSVGVHPLDLEDPLVTHEQLFEHTSHERVVALGETGLDFYYSAESQKQQADSFVTHLEVGKATGLPVIVHTRSAKKETMALLKAHALAEKGGVLHCFTESIEMARQALDIGFYISLSGIVTFKNADALREVARYVPLDRLLIETDAPYLAPVPHRGKQNEPKFVVEVGDFIAELRDMNKESFVNQTTCNFFMLFSKAEDTRIS